MSLPSRLFCRRDSDTPILFTRIWMRGSASSDCASARTSSSDAKFATQNSAPMSAAAPRSLSASRPVMITRQPCRAISRAVARPIPALPPVTTAVFTAVLQAHRALEPAEDHPLAVERHLLRVHHLGEARVLHHVRHAFVARRARLVDDVGEDHGLVLLELHALRKRCPL